MSLEDATDPFDLFILWFAEAKAAEPYNTDAAALATCTPEGRPSARIVLVRGADRHGFAFFTNRESRKGGELNANPHAALCFYWKSLLRQIRIEGDIELVSDAQSDAYFNGRPRGSRIGAWASAQSRPVESRQELETKVAEFEAHYPDETIPRPPYWGGYRLVPRRIEFWQEQTFRLHDRIQFDRQGESWTRTRLNP